MLGPGAGFYDLVLLCQAIGWRLAYKGARLPLAALPFILRTIFEPVLWSSTFCFSASI